MSSASSSAGPSEGDFAEPPPGAAEVHAIYLLEEVQGTGVGRALLERVTEAMRANGYRHAVLWVFEANDRARRFYEAAGWSPDGERAEHRFDAREPAGAAVRAGPVIRSAWPDRPRSG